MRPNDAKLLSPLILHPFIPQRLTENQMVLQTLKPGPKLNERRSGTAARGTPLQSERDGQITRL